MLLKTLGITFFPDVCAWNFFLYRRVGDFLLYGLFFSVKVVVENTKFSPFVSIFKLEQSPPYTSQILLQISHDLHFPATEDLVTDLCSSQEYSVWLTVIFNSLKTNIRMRFAILQFWTLQSLNLWTKSFFGRK